VAVGGMGVSVAVGGMGVSVAVGGTGVFVAEGVRGETRGTIISCRKLGILFAAIIDVNPKHEAPPIKIVPTSHALHHVRTIFWVDNGIVLFKFSKILCNNISSHLTVCSQTA